MTLRLILIRHAKSDWDDPLMDDHDRPLNARGRASASAIGAWLRERGEAPDTALVSTATRAVQTWEGVRPDLPGCTARFLPQLYLAPPQTMLDVLGGAFGSRVLMIGHNPGIAMLARALVRRKPDHQGFDAFPTAATLIAEFDADRWDRIVPGRGAAVAFTVPRDLLA